MKKKDAQVSPGRRVGTKMRSVVVLIMFATVCSLPAHAAGAIATDDVEAGAVYALVTGAASRDDAGDTALAECRRNGGKHCKVMARFDRCGAFAALAGKRLYGAGWGDSGDIARSMALAKCADHACKVQALECE
jgi:hypothetical protein